MQSVKTITCFILLLINSIIYSQGCEDPYPLGEMGTWSECWEAPQTFSDDCFDAYPETDLCGGQCGGAYLEFEVGSLGLATFFIESDMNYDFYDIDSAPELWVHFYIMVADSCDTPIFYTSGCGSLYPPIGEDLLLETTGGGSVMGISDDYIMTLNLPPGDYVMVVGNVGTVSVQDNIEGCLEIGYLTQGILELTILPAFEIVAEPYEKEVPQLIAVKDIMGRDVKYIELLTQYIFCYSDGTTEKKIIVE